MRYLLRFSAVVLAWAAATGPATPHAEASRHSVGPRFACPGEAALDAGAARGPDGLTGSKQLPPRKAPIIQARPGRFIRVLCGAALASGGDAPHGRPTPSDEAAARCTTGAFALRAPGRHVLLCRFLL